MTTIDQLQAELPGQTMPTTPPPPPMPWGFHGIFDCDKCNLTKIQDQINLANFIAELTTALSLSSISKVSIGSNGTEQYAGYILSQIYKTGSITIHFSDVNQQAYVDLFMYNEFSPTVVDSLLIKYLGDDIAIHKILMPRNASVG